ncbi:restriction endonuclease Mrr [Halarchaeum rubridurum]|uniref:Restriction endonuclease n=1 Tax=Halarchaeum rubridurum TaxID=489911 RepID=A0A830FNE0_9EURY|nr:restriction endonuclease [Halarchaeum rubridurum]MBP1953300.1 restriction endonuclease Mrr [Halarchaeum rubridurum]GGM66349.1 restriction endonuclease [Halarchaeum rubridurum]
MPVLDELSGFEFEDVMEDVFRNLGYENVHQAARTADEGRDVLMEEVVDGERRGIVVECKHTDSVGRPVVQKLHSAVATYDFDGPTRGIVATTGRFTRPAREYAQRLRENDDPHPVDLLDGEDLREFADEIGLDLYNGRIEILCNDTLRPYDPATSLDAPVTAAMRDIENLDAGDLPDPDARVTFRPTVIVTAETDATFETSVGVIHRVHERNRLVVQAERGHPEQLPPRVAELVTSNRHATVELDEAGFGEVFDEVETRRFGETQTEYKEWAMDRLREHHTTTVSYTGDNNVTYTKTCEPNRSDVTVHAVEAVYLPDVRQTTELGEYTYPLEYYAAGPSRVTTEDGIHACVHCETTGDGETYTYCANCGSINCAEHVRTERLEGTPVCTGCAVTERFMLSTKYFYDEDNREAFREEYDAMAFYEKLGENVPLAVGATLGVLVLVVGSLVAVGVL